MTSSDGQRNPFFPATASGSGRARGFIALDSARMRCGDDRECFLTPGVATEITVDLWSTAMVFSAGHTVRIDVSGSNALRFEVNPNYGGDCPTWEDFTANKSGWLPL